MRVAVAIEAHFYIVDGNAYSSYLTFESFWKRYLKVFDSVLIIARATEVDQVPAGHEIVTEKGVELAPLPRYHGPYQYLRKLPRIHQIIRESLRYDDACILRVSGNIGTQVWKHLRSGHPFGVEVMMDPWDTFAPGSVKSVGRILYRRLWTRDLKRQCRQAAAASYVTERFLQKRYPPNPDAFTTHYSSLNLDKNLILANSQARLADIKEIGQQLTGRGLPVRLGFIGTFSQTHKLPDIHIKACARCVKKGANVILEMIGDGAHLEDMRALADNLGIADRVIFRGRLPGGKPILDAIDSFDLFLNATAAEGLPRVVIEAMSRGCPCIASDVGGTGELLEQKYLVPPKNVDALAATISRVLNDPEGMAEAVEYNVRIARNYTADVLDPRRKALYQALRERTEKYISAVK